MVIRGLAKLETAPVAAMEEVLKQLRGTYGFVAVFKNYPDLIIAARLGSPLVIGIGDGEHFVASDGSPLAGYTDQIVYLADNQLAIITEWEDASDPVTAISQCL